MERGDWILIMRESKKEMEDYSALIQELLTETKSRGGAAPDITERISALNQQYDEALKRYTEASEIYYGSSRKRP